MIPIIYLEYSSDEVEAITIPIHFIVLPSLSPAGMFPVLVSDHPYSIPLHRLDLQLLFFSAAVLLTTFSRPTNPKIIEGEDETISLAADLVLTSLDNPEKVQAIKSHTGRNLSDQLTLLEIEEIRSTYQLHLMGSSRN